MSATHARSQFSGSLYPLSETITKLCLQRCESDLVELEKKKVQDEFRFSEEHLGPFGWAALLIAGIMSHMLILGSIGYLGEGPWGMALGTLPLVALGCSFIPSLPNFAQKDLRYFGGCWLAVAIHACCGPRAEWRITKVSGAGSIPDPDLAQIAFRLKAERDEIAFALDELVDPDTKKVSGRFLIATLGKEQCYFHPSTRFG